MNDSMKMLSPGRAASLVDVHESTIKRWCDAGDLACTYTEGGHRRIALSDLLEFARSNVLDSPLLVFRSWAADVWEALCTLEQNDDPAPMIDLLYGWLETPWTGLPGQLIVFCLEQGVPVTLLFDNVLRPVLYRVGDNWEAGFLGIGDEHRMSSMMRDALVPVRHYVNARVSGDADEKVAIVGCAGGTHHEMGALMVRIVLEARGWQVVYLGGCVPVEEFALQQQKFEALLLGISVTPPLVPSDARRIVSALARMYDADRPLHVALGGEIMREVTAEDVSPHPFASCRLYDSIVPFETWLEGSPLEMPFSTN